MKILIGLTYYLPNISGVTQYANILAEELVKRKHDVRVICARTKPSLNPSLDPPKAGRHGGLQINRVWGFPFGKGFIMPMYWLLSIKQVLWSDVINCHLPSIESFWLAFWGKIFRKKLIITYHCQFVTQNKLLNNIIDLIQNYVLASSDKIIVNSYDYINGYNILSSFRNKIVEVYPPIKVGQTEKKLNLIGKFKIGYLGRISSEKNIEILLETITKLPKDYCLYIAGPDMVIGEEEYKMKIFKKINNNPKIQILGKINNPIKFYNSIDCLILPSKNRLESFGMVCAEAIVSGCPVIVSNIPGARVPVLVTHGGLIFEPTNASDLAKKIIEVINDKTKYINNAKNLDLFNYKKTVDQYEKVFEKLLR